MQRRPVRSDFNKPAVRPLRMKRTVRTLLSPEQMNQAMARESARVDRRGAGVLSLVLFRIPGTRSKQATTWAVRLARTIIKRIRVTDDLGWFDEDHIGMLLPDTTPGGAWQLAQEVCDAVAKRRNGVRPLVTLYSYPADANAQDADNSAAGMILTSDAAETSQPPQVPHRTSTAAPVLAAAGVKVAS
jgi:hypothetical protein